MNRSFARATGAFAGIVFAAGCSLSSPDAPGVGSIRILVETVGRDPDPDGYVIAVDGGPRQPLFPTGSLVLTDVPVGRRAVALSGVATNCWASLGLTRTVEVTANQVATVEFAITCTERSGTGTGSVTGLVRGSGSGYPVNGNGIPGERALGWPLYGIAATSSGQPTQWTREDSETGSFRFERLATGQWTLSFLGFNPWTMIFPDMRLYADTALTVTVLKDQTVVLPELVLRPVAPFIVVATEVCPWGFASVPSYNDWGNCDSGYWGGIEVRVEVRGIAGTTTDGVLYSFSIPRDRWFTELHDVRIGEYDVSVVPVDSSTAWQLLPWQQSPMRLRVDQGLAYAEFDFWYLR